MRVPLAFLICWATGAVAQDSTLYMDRAVEVLRAGLAPVATWAEKRSAGQVIFQCRNCAGQVVVVLRHMNNYAEGSGFAGPQALYEAGRRQLCRELVAQRRGRGVDAHRSLEDGTLVYEWVRPDGTHLHAGYMSAPQDAAQIEAILPVLRNAVQSLSALW